ncbi:MAG: response regulator [Terriglobales bacterium]
MHLANTKRAPGCVSHVPASSRPVSTILLVEDEALVRQVTCEVLQSAGYRVLPARNALEATQAFHAHPEEVQLLVTDVVLPDRNGCDLAHELSTLSRDIRTIFVSGYPENSITRKGVQSAEWTYLPKPFSAAVLLQKVKEVLGKEALNQRKSVSG